jgi:poly(beta-D-mannuronate) lyase
MTDGTWTNQAVVLKAKGTVEKPVTLRAQTSGKVILTGKSSVTVDGEFIIVRGLLIQGGTAPGDGISLAGRRNRLTETAMVGGANKYFVHLRGYEQRVDHCYLAGKTSEGPTLQVEVAGLPNHHQIDHNHFGPRRRLGRNGGETIRVGYSHQSMTNSSTLVEYNLFDRCDGELEIISNKACDNTYRGNTFLDCAGMLTLRHGNRCLVDGNFFLGHHKSGTGGIRIIGEDHALINNYFEGIERGAFWITAGVPNSKLEEYFQAQRCTVAFNSVFDSKGPLIELDAGYGSSKRSLRPARIAIANNFLAPAGKEPVLKGTEGTDFKWLGNVLSGPVGPGLAGRFADAGVGPVRDANGLFRPGRPVPAAGEFPDVTRDMDGQARTGKPQVGSDQDSTDPVTVRPMTVLTTGPAWLERTAGEAKAGARR